MKAILTCSDPRLIPTKINDEKPFIVRNAGAMPSDDAIRSLKLAVEKLGVDEILVVCHTDCAAGTAEQSKKHGQAIKEAIPEVEVRSGTYDIESHHVTYDARL